MKIKIDTQAKTIQLEQSAKLTELFSLVKKIFPNNEWKEYTIQVVPWIVDWRSQIYIPSVWTDLEFKDEWTITYSDSTETYCIEVN